MQRKHIKKVGTTSLCISLVFASLLCGCTKEAENKHGIEHIRHYLKLKKYHTAYRRAHALARRGHPRAQTVLGLLYQYGVGVEKDMAKAVSWFEKAAGQGEGQAAYELGVIFLGTPADQGDIAKAEYWLNKAAEHGVREAQLRLGLMYLNGDGVTKNLYHAHILLRRAALQGSEEAKETLLRIPAVKQASDSATKSEKDYSDGLYNLRDSWEGYADIVTSVRDAAKAGGTSP